MAYDEKIRKKVQILYKKGATFKEIFDEYKISINTLKYWAYKYKWERKNHTEKPHQTKRKLEKVCVGKLQNTNALKHGLFAKYLPQETLELVGDIEIMSPIDILWENICLKYAAIIRSQKIMFVKDADDVTQRITMRSDEAVAYQYTEAYDKQASFLIAQSRAMGTLLNLIKQYDELCRSDFATEEQKLRIAKMKADIDKIKENTSNEVTIVDNISDLEIKTNADKFE